MSDWDRIIGEAVGEGSMCWHPIPSGVFDPEAAGVVVRRTVALIEAELAAERAHADRLEDALTDALRMALAALAAERAHADGLVEVLTRLQPLQQSRERRLIAVALVEHIRRREAES